MPKLFLVHDATGKKYEILRVDRDSGMMTLQGPRAKFDEVYDPAALKQRGYSLCKETGHAEQ